MLIKILSIYIVSGDKEWYMDYCKFPLGDFDSSNTSYLFDWLVCDGYESKKNIISFKYIS